MKKGFTLIELLAVIVILAIILLIAVPMVTSVIEDAKKGAIEASAGMTMKAIENEHLRQKLGGSTGEIEVVIEDYVQTSTDKLELNGKNIKEGYIHINTAGDITMVVTDGITIIEKDPTSNDLNTLAEEYESQDLLAMFNTLKAKVSVAFNCGDVLTDSRDSNTYETVQIGTQCWFAEDLKYDCSLKGYININDVIMPSWSGNTNCGNQGIGYDGVVYQWNVAMDSEGVEGSQGLCPTGWHIPTHEEWTDLERTICKSTSCLFDFQYSKTVTGWRGTNEGQKLKSTDPSWGGIDEIGFNGKPSGSRTWQGTLHDVNTSAYWWTSSTSGDDALRRYLYENNSGIYHFITNKLYAASVRCVMD